MARIGFMSDSLEMPATAVRPARRRPRRWLTRLVLAAIAGALGATGWWHTTKPLLPGMHVIGNWVPVPLNGLLLLADVTTADAYGRPVVHQEIFDETLRVIADARDFIVLDFFLFNGNLGQSREATTPPARRLAAELRDALIAAKRAHPDLRILLISDPINDVYGAEPSPDFALLTKAGVEVVRTHLDRLRDSNPLYSSCWRLAMSWWSDAGEGAGWLPNPLETAPSQLSFRAWARLLNLKANHRKVVIADDGRKGLVGVVGSANPHDASSSHSNLALGVRGFALLPLLQSELAIARFSGWRGNLPLALAAAPRGINRGIDRSKVVLVRVLSEGAIEDAVLEQIRGAHPGDHIDAALFYLAERNIIEALLGAAARGVEVRVLLDPNGEAFGRSKSGIPNRPVASELLSQSDGAVKIRWYRTHGEQFHVKMLAVRSPERLWLTLGSANFTRRNLDDYNLEANVAVEAAANTPFAGDVSRWFETLWNNRGPPGSEYTTDFGTYADPEQISYWSYRVMEASGLSTF